MSRDGCIEMFKKEKITPARGVLCFGWRELGEERHIYIYYLLYIVYSIFFLNILRDNIYIYYLSIDVL